jgi:RNA polymerase sigma-70 factor (ECF subfamily)
VHDLAIEYLAHAKPSAGPPPDAAALQRELAALVDDGRRAWPAVDLAPRVFVRHLAERSEGPPGASVRAADLWLACGCAHGVPAAIEVFTRHYLARVPEFLSRAAGAAEVAEETRLVLEQRLLVGDGDRRGRIADYRGRGSLEGWLRAAATRTARNLERSERRHRRATGKATAEARLLTVDPEEEYVKNRYRPQVEEAVRGALLALPVRDRGLLRLHYVERVGIGRLATMHGVHRATVGRWMLEAQRALVADTRRILRETMGLTDSECDSLVPLLGSRLDLALSAVLSPPR